jgi:hypothetical protein
MPSTKRFIQYDINKSDKTFQPGPGNKKNIYDFSSFELKNPKKKIIG